MSDKAKASMENISGKLNDLPQDVADAALDQFAARMEGYAEGFAAGKAYAQTRPN